MKSVLRAIAKPVLLPLHILRATTSLVTGSIMRVLPKAQCASLRWAAAAPGSVRAASHAVRGPAAPQAVAQAQELPPDVESLIKRIHASRTKAVVYTTGGAVQVRRKTAGSAGQGAADLPRVSPWSRCSMRLLLSFYSWHNTLRV